MTILHDLIVLFTWRKKSDDAFTGVIEKLIVSCAPRKRSDDFGILSLKNF